MRRYVLLLLFFSLRLQAVETAAPENLRDFVRRLSHRQAYGVYLGEQKFGWMLIDFRLGELEGKEVAVRRIEGKLVMAVDDEKTVSEFQSTVYFDLEGEGGVLRAEEENIEDGAKTRITARPISEGYEIKTHVAGVDIPRQIPAIKENLRALAALARWLDSKPAPDETFELYSLSLDLPDVNAKEIYRLKKKERILWAGVPRDVYHVELDFLGLRSEGVLGSAGMILKGKIAGLLDLRAEEEVQAKDLSQKPIDWIEASSVRLDRPIGDLERLETLALEIRGLEADSLPASARQRLERDGDFLVLHLSRETRERPKDELTPAERERFLRSSPLLLSDHARLKGLAKEIVGAQTDPRKKIQRISDWVYDNLEKTYSSNAMTSLQVLERKAGDCSEHTILFVALARAAGLPAREVGGLLLIGEDPPLFGWHAWAEVHDGGHWIGVDPTWDRVLLDATYIKLSEGTEDWSWGNLIGRLEFKLRRAVLREDAR